MKAEKKLQANALGTEFKRQKKGKRKSQYFAITIVFWNIDNARPVCEAVWNYTEATGFKDEIPKLDFITSNSSSTLIYATSEIQVYLLDKPELMG